MYIIVQGGENPSLNEVSFGAGATPQLTTFQTPNPLSQFRPGTGMTMLGQTPGVVSSLSGVTPMRDALSLHGE